MTSSDELQPIVPCVYCMSGKHVYTRMECCLARSILNTPMRKRREAFEAVKETMDDAEWARFKGYYIALRDGERMNGSDSDASETG